MKRTVFFSLILGIFCTAISCSDTKKNSEESAVGEDSLRVTAGKYVNEKFGFSISYPSEILSPDTSVASDSGQVFKSADGMADLKVWIDPRITIVEGEAINLKALYEKDTAYKSGYDNNYQVFKTTSYTISGVRGGQIIYYQKTIISNGHVVTGLLRYQGNAPDKKTYDAMIEPLFKSFK
ncbi:MAG: hypothetical protein LBR34_12335 [Prevotella sp.]|jgi:hypothetical protein|nr:hypothetical protein [Prevotella sp.]